MKQSIRKLFSLLLAVVMALSLAVPAFADEGDPPEKELRWVHLDWDENGKAFARDEALKDEDHGNSTEYDPAHGDAVLFFIWNNKTNKREGYVVPKAGDGLRVEKLSKDAIASGAKQSQYYVFLYMDKFQDSEVTASGLSFKVIAKLGDFGFYSAATPSADTILGNEVEAAKLTGNTLYFCAPYMGTAEAAGRGAVTKVEKDPNTVDFNKLYDVESVKDGLWKITINDMGKNQLKQGGGIWVNLKLEVKDPDGNTHEEGRSINLQGEERGPELFFADLADEWDDAGNQSFFVNKDFSGQGNGKQVHAGYERVGIFGTIKEGQNAYTDGFNWDAFVPVDVKTLKAPAGLTVESVSDQARKGENWAKYFVKVSVAENGKEYKVTSGDYSITISSKLPDISVYSAPTASFDSWAGEYEYPYHPAKADNTYYIISTAADDDGLNNRHLTGAKLTGWEENKLVDLEKVSDNVYKLTIKDASQRRFHVELDLTWTDVMGNTWTDTNCGFGDFWLAPSIVAGSTKLTDKYEEALPYSEIAGKVSTALSMAAGESKTVYLYTTPLSRDGLMYRAFGAMNAANFRSNNAALTLAFDEKDPSKFTLSVSKAGTYEIWMGGKDWDYENIKFTHADGTPYTEAERKVWYEEEYPKWDIDANGKMLVWGPDQTVLDAVPFEEYTNGDTCEIGLLNEEIREYGWKRLTVTVTGEAKTFTDVKSTDWFCKEVNWAVAQGIAAGTSATTFSPKSDCTHAEILTFLWRAAGQPKSTAALPFTPKNTWAAGALAWAYEKGMIGASFSETAKCTSADAVNYIWQAKGKPAASYDGRFTDVPKDAAYAEAVAWAVNAGVTVGTTSTTFDPAAVCSRGRIATFLFRAFSK